MWTSVGDSLKGPLNNQGETRLKPAKNAKHEPTCAPKTHAQHKHDPGGPAARHDIITDAPRVKSASLEG
jgi:hypothetical protein